jgi:Ni/Co efflux regulator RcnB
MKKILLTITAVGALAVPAGIAAAQTDDDVTETETPTTVVCDQDQSRDQLRLHDGTGDQERTQQRLQTYECDECEQAQVRVREQVRVEDGQGEMVRNQARVEDCDACTGDQLRDRARVEDGTGVPQQQDNRQYQEQDREPYGMGDQAGPGRGGR